MISMTQLLDFFERAPRLREIKLMDSLPDSSNAPAERGVHLSHLVLLRIYAQPAHSILLNHLHIPTGALVILQFHLGEDSPIPDHLSRSLDNLTNVSRVTSISLDFSSRMAMRLKGPSGDLYVIGTWAGSDPVPDFDLRVLRSLKMFPISTAERLAITQYDASADPKTGESGAYQTLFLMNNLRTLTLTDCLILSFVLALNPSHNASNEVMCPRLEEVILYIQDQDESYIDELLEMAEVRFSRGAKLSMISIVCPWELIPVEKVFDLRKYVSRVEYRLDNELPRWDAIPGEVDEIDDNGDWLL
jgi:hypothetical protein